MWGIAGVAFVGRGGAAAIGLMTKTHAHRGPEESGIAEIGGHLDFNCRLKVG